VDILTHLSNKNKCDKSDDKHNYTPIYNLLFERFIDKEFRMLELGYGEGNSIKMWLEYFPKIKLIGVDIMKGKPNNLIVDDRFDFFIQDQTDLNKLMQIFDKYKEFFIIIDDASHVAEDQQYTFGNIFSYVSSGGWYVIEDLECKRKHSTKFGVTTESTLIFLKEFINKGYVFSKVLTNEQNKYLSKNIECIDIFGRIAFIKKKGKNIWE
jgi:hypothetical protein